MGAAPRETQPTLLLALAVTIGLLLVLGGVLGVAWILFG